MAVECARCGHVIDMSTESGAEQGVVRAWVDDEYRDYHRMCRDHDLEERRSAKMDAVEGKRRPGRPRKNPEPVAVSNDEEGMA